MASPAPSLPWSSYLRWMLTTLVVCVTAVGAFNTLIDPLGIFGSKRITGLNATKPYLDHHRELARWQAARRTCSSAGIFGNSRAEIGLDPTHPAFAAHGLAAFNHAIPGSAASSSLQQLDWLQAAGCAPKLAILGVEFVDFLGSTKPGRLGPGKAAPAIDGRVLAETTLSITGLRDSLKTIAIQHARNAATLTERGFNPLDNYITEVENSGHYVLFRQRAEENWRIWNHKPRAIQPADGSPSSDQQAVDAFLSTLTQGGGTAHVVIYPYHAEIRLMQARLGIADLFADWKRLIVATASRHPGVKVWDFSGISQETLEAIPAPGDRQTQLKYYWEAGHFKKALGDKLLARVMGEDNGFGVELRPDNLEAWLSTDRQRLDALLATPSPLLKEVDDVAGYRKR
ncbi:hypothetical protein [Zoogloea sp.]|uniref:hypothetical protein n=1 Tax=Zoogloea sp. TaxID=49181 RepID=UPI001415935A|nr:MAG: hypothetical protein F9K15_01210 [Zoogloea sp.]